MRTPKNSSALTATICAAALFAVGCGRESEEPQTADLETPPAVEQSYPASEVPPPAGVELQEERSVEARDQVAAAERDDLDVHERELDRREADLEARAKRLRDLKRREQDLSSAEREIERRETAKAKRPAPAPAREEPAEPAEELAGAEAEEVAPAPEPQEEIAEEAPPQPRLDPVTVDSGTVFSVELLERLSSESSRPGETFRARVTGDIRQDGRVVIPAGSEVVGEVTEAVPLRKVGGRAKLAIRFSDLVLPSGSSVRIEASFAGQGRSETGRDAATIGGAAAGGAILGRVLNRGDRSRGAVIGAIIGAAVGTAVASRTPGEEVTFDEGAVVDLQLDAPVEIRPRR